MWGWVTNPQNCSNLLYSARPINHVMLWDCGQWPHMTLCCLLRTLTIYVRLFYLLMESTSHSIFYYMTVLVKKNIMHNIPYIYFWCKWKPEWNSWGQWFAIIIPQTNWLPPGDGLKFSWFIIRNQIFCHFLFSFTSNVKFSKQIKWFVICKKCTKKETDKGLN